jgi:hypothetical protein
MGTIYGWVFSTGMGFLQVLISVPVPIPAKKPAKKLWVSCAHAIHYNQLQPVSTDCLVIM